MVLAIISKMCNWYQSRNDDYVSPVVRGMAAPRGTGGRQRILDDDEIRALWKASADMRTFGAIVKLLLLTGQRRDKVAKFRGRQMGDPNRAA